MKVSLVRPGQEFRHYGQKYVAATTDEATRHPGRAIMHRHPWCRLHNPGVQPFLAYAIEKKKRTPVTFLLTEKVLVR